ncbi:MAG: carbohydrate binding family 9 domain-containing protein [Acidobacteria bacterium]|nr:carbohydrate binding family 9 domain-containing protein [Acidobacteriota bacterium]
MTCQYLSIPALVCLASWGLVLADAGSAFAGQMQLNGGDPAVASSPTATASRIAERPLLDGDVIGDPAWQGATPVEGFTQEQPDLGAPASERTEVRLVFTADTLYVGVVCYDRDPSGIIVSDSRRDAPLEDTDSFRLIFDTYRDRQNGFVFGTNPAGIEYDGQVTNEGQGGGGLAGAQMQQSGSGSGFNLNWDGAWEVRAKITEIGWTAEFAIPFRTLRFPSGTDQVWGVNFQRNIRRRNERAYWAPIPQQFSLYRLSLAGALSGIQTPSIRNLKVTPYVLGNILTSGNRPVESVTLGDVGGDVKYSLTSSLTLDATVNTDFAQVEVDDQQVNLDRFNLFFPEKRPFFLENAGFFSVGNPGEVDLFFSRRIGIGPGGEEVPILAGGRVSGKAGQFNIGLLNMQTDDFSEQLASTNFSVVRISRDLPNRSQVGGLFVNRQGVGNLAPDDDRNGTYAVDGKWGIGQSTVLSSFLAQTDTPGVSADEYAFNVRSRTNLEQIDIELGYQEVADQFNPEVGFLSRRGYRKPDARVMTRFRPKDFLRLQEIRPHVTYRGFWGFDDFQETGYSHIDSHWQFRNAYEVHTGMNLTLEGVRTPFEIYPGIFVPPGTYDNAEAQIVLMTNQGAPFSLNLQTFAGGFFNGKRVTLNPTVRARFGETLTTEVSYQRNDVSLPTGDFVTNLVRTRVSYSFTPRTFVQGLVQYNDRADLWSMNFRLGWLQAANTGLFVVYTDTRGLYDLVERPQRTDRSFIVKYSYMFDVLR